MNFAKAIMILELEGVDLNVWRIDTFKAKAKYSYRQLSKKHHPDVGGKLENFLRLREAFDFLDNLEELPKAQHKKSRQPLYQPKPPKNEIPSRGPEELFYLFINYLRGRVGQGFVVEYLANEIKATPREENILWDFTKCAKGLGYIELKIMYIPLGITLMRFELACKLRGVNGMNFGMFPNDELRAYENFYESTWGHLKKDY